MVVNSCKKIKKKDNNKVLILKFSLFLWNFINIYFLSNIWIK
jgi:hypothetical protein